MNTNRDLNYRLYIQKDSPCKKAPFRDELEGFRAISAGDAERVRQSFEEIKKARFKGKRALSDDPVINIRYHFIISAATVSRMCARDGMDCELAYTLCEDYVRRADACGHADGITALLGEMLVDYANRMKNVRKSSVVSIHIRKCIDYIYEHLQEKLTVAGAAEYLGLDPSYLSKLFIKETGIGFRQFIINTKINAAKNMMTDPELSFLEISLSLGFSSQSAFITAFRKNTGKTPGEYRASVI